MNALRATYRLQLHAGFAFADAQRLLPYWQSLGVSHLYLSPITQAHPGSTHGYDMVDPTRISAELGGEDAFRRFAEAAQAQGLLLILDIVPNHMGVGADNPFWMEMLEFGPEAPGAAVFDVDWSRGHIHLPFLRGSLEEAVAEDAFRLALDETARIVVRYFEHEFPLRPEMAAKLFEKAAGRAGSTGGAELAHEWARMSDGLDAREILCGRLRDSFAREATLRQALEAVLHEASPKEFLADQHWRLAPWRTAATEINYRRFFDVPTLAAVRIEEPRVFDLFHRLPLRLVDEGLVHGLRIDHIDGLALPAAYCDELRRRVGPAVSIHVEKILALDEGVPDWPIDGTTGYEGLNLINGLFIEGNSYEKLRSFATIRLGVEGNPQGRIAEAKRMILARSFAADFDRVIADAERLAAGRVPAAGLRKTLAEYVARLPVYRTYLSHLAPSGEEEAFVETVIDDVAVFSPESPSEATNLLRDWLTGTADPPTTQFRLRLQQLTGPVMAKGYEDTELYRYVVLLSANEVGGSIEWPYFTAGEFHARMSARRRRKKSLVPLSTHDTKRGADTRARLNVLSETGDAWLKAVSRWSKSNEALRRTVRGGQAPDAADEVFIYQSMMGVWPADPPRLKSAMLKSLREAKRSTSWEDPDPDYEQAVMDFLDALLTSDSGAGFRADFAEQAEVIAAAGRRNSVQQLVLQFTIPGVPDIYQGTELWDLALVDPDNRRPVDWEARRQLTASPGIAWDEESGAGKMALLRHLLRLRAQKPLLFSEGDYVPVSLESGTDCNVSGIAFLRRTGEEALLVVVETRAFVRDGGARVLTLPPELGGAWTDFFTGRQFTLRGDVALRDLPPPPILLLRDG